MAIIGMALMVLTLVWRVNPVEGSVMPDFLTDNPFGVALLFVLLGTCMPVWMVAVFAVVALNSFVGLPEQDAWALGGGAAVILQGIVYLMLGRLTSVIMARFRGRD